MTSPFIIWNGRLVERAFYDFCVAGALLDPVERQCPTCSGMGTLLEQIDEDRPEFAVPCWRCKGKGRI